MAKLMSIDYSYIRNFVITAHIDHGKSTLADRMLELTGAVSSRELREQTLDQMDLERERGITIKLAPVRMRWTPSRAQIRNPKSEIRNKFEVRNSNDRNISDFDIRASDLSNEAYTLHLIDTPGHVDFTYEVSRSLAAVEGAVLLVDATQGVQAQTIANLSLAIEQGLTIIPAVNKIDLPNADIERTKEELVQLVGCSSDDILLVSGKTGQGVAELLDAIIARVPAPRHDSNASDYPLRALIFDSVYDDYRGVIAYVRVVDGEVRKGNRLRLMVAGMEIETLEVGTFSPKLSPLPSLGSGEIGYIVTGLKDIRAVRVGDTITGRGQPASIPLSGYAEVKPMVFAGIFPHAASEAERLRDAIERLRLNDASLTYEPEHSSALGFGFRCGFLGLLHLEIVQERLRREHGIEIVVTVPSVAYKVVSRKSLGDSRTSIIVRSPQGLPDPGTIERIEEPWVRMDVVTPERYIGALMRLCQEKRGLFINTDYLAGGLEGARRAMLHYDLPLAVVLVDFYDRLKSASQGYASMNYEFIGYRPANVRRLDILIAGECSESLASIVYEDEAMLVGRRIVEKLKEAIPRQQFEVRLQAALGGKIVASERIPPLRKDVLAKMSGGDVTRKMKLLAKQRKGKKAMRVTGRVELPPQAYLAVLKR
ncbi:MAG: translation elongation factor 4 [Candidatus Uhrbacteria bacterium]